MPPICDKSFSFGEEQIGPICCLASSCCIITKLKKTNLTKVSNLKKQILLRSFVFLPSFRRLELFRSVSKSGALALSWKVGKSPTSLMLWVSSAFPGLKILMPKESIHVNLSKKLEILAAPSTCRDHNSWAVGRMRVYLCFLEKYQNYLPLLYYSFWSFYICTESKGHNLSNATGPI
jgi:hypothetical protein